MFNAGQNININGNVNINSNNSTNSQEKEILDLLNAYKFPENDNTEILNKIEELNNSISENNIKTFNDVFDFLKEKVPDLAFHSIKSIINKIMKK